MLELFDETGLSLSDDFIFVGILQDLIALWKDSVIMMKDNLNLKTCSQLIFSVKENFTVVFQRIRI